MARCLDSIMIDGRTITSKMGLIVAFLVLLVTASCASVDCAYDTSIRPEPLYLNVEEGHLYGQNYVACFLIDGVIHKEYIPECAYRYYYDRQARRQVIR